MIYLQVLGAISLAFANGANDNFKGVATLWGTARYSYRTVLLWATLWTVAGSLGSSVLSAGLVKVFNGSQWLGVTSLDTGFLAATALAAATAVLIATWVGAPVSTTHALIGSLAGAGILSAGLSGVRWMQVAYSIVIPLLVSPLLALGSTLAFFPLVRKWVSPRSCVCVIEPPALIPSGDAVRAVASLVPGLRIAGGAECQRGDEVMRWNTEEVVHWVSAGLISFSRGLNDTPKIVALMLPAESWTPAASYLAVGLMMAVGGLAAARRIALTMSRRVTRIEPVTGLTANLVGAVLVAAASRWALPVSTTHITMGGIFGIGVRQYERTDWGLVRQILLAWVVTLPIGLLCGLAFYHGLALMGGK